MMYPHATLPTRYGTATIWWFHEGDHEHCVLVFGDISMGKDILTRIHSSCLTGDVFHSLKCDCGEQLDGALEMISKTGGILIYLAQEGRGIGLINKIRAYALQDEWLDTVDANEQLGLPADNRQYRVVKEILQVLQIKSIRLITNNPAKIEALEAYGIAVHERVPLIVEGNIFNKDYLETKQHRMRHMF